MVLGTLVGVEVDVHDLRARRPDVAQFREHFRDDVGANHEVGVARLEDRQAVLAEHVPGHALVERMPLGHVHFAGIGLPNAGAKEFGDTGQFVLRTRIRHAVAHEDHRAAGRREDGRGLLDERWRRHYARRWNRRRPHRFLRDRVQDVLRQTDVDRSHRRRRGDLDGAAQDAQQRRGVLHHRRPLGDRTHHADEIAGHLRVHRGVLDTRVAANDHQRRVATFRLVERADTVADAGRTMELHERRLLRRTGVAVRGEHGNRFLQRQDVLHLRVGPQRIEEPLLNSTGVAEHVRDAVSEELLDDGEMAGLVTHDCETACLRKGAKDGCSHRTRGANTRQRACYQPYRRRPFSSTCTISSPTRCESCVDRPVRNG